MGEVNWTVTLFLGAILSIPFGVLTNLITPIVKENIERAILSTQNKKLDRLQKEYEITKRLYDNVNLLVIEVTQLIINIIGVVIGGIGGLAASIMLDLAPNFFLPMLSLDTFIKKLILISMLSFSFWLFMDSSKKAVEFGQTAIRLKNFEKYEKEVLEKIGQIKSEPDNIKDHRNKKSRR